MSPLNKEVEIGPYRIGHSVALSQGECNAYRRMAHLLKMIRIKSATESEAIEYCKGIDLEYGISVLKSGLFRIRIGVMSPARPKEIRFLNQTLRRAHGIEKGKRIKSQI